MQFSLERVPFIVLPGGNVAYGWCKPKSCKDWSMRVHGISEEFWENTTRGYIMEGRVQFFTGRDYRCADVKPEVLSDVMFAYRMMYHKPVTQYYNGCKMGADEEVWQPLTIIPWEGFKC